MISEADAVVIGAGALGLSAALHLAQQGLQRVVAIDRFAPGTQASPRAAGMFKHVQATETLTKLKQLSVRKVLQFEQEFGVPLSVTQPGSMLLARTPEHAALIRHEVRQSQGWGVDVELVDGAEAHRLAPYLEADGLLAAAYIPGDAYIEEPFSLIEAYLAAGERLGLEVIEHTPVTGIRLRNGEVEGVVTSAGEIATPVVVDAAGAWARGVGEFAEIQVPVEPVRHQLFITEPITGIDPQYPILRIIDTSVYMRPARSGLMLGAFESDPFPIDTRAKGPDFSTDDLPLDISVLTRLAKRVEHLVPAVQGVEVNEHRGGMFTMTPDGRFLTGPVPGVPGLWTSTGCNGSGFSFSPALGQMLAEWIVGGEPSLDMSSLSPARFPSPLSDEEIRSSGVWQYANYYTPEIETLR